MTYRFSLGKILDRCPQCGRRTFKPYMDNATGLPLDAAACGRCNREAKCRYHLTPAQWFAAGGKAAPAPPGWTPPPPPPPDFLSVNPVTNVSRLGSDNLYTFLAPRFGDDRVTEVFRQYRVMHTDWNGGATAFFLIDTDGRCRSAKLMRYGPDGHRLKSRNHAADVTYMHALAGYRNFVYRACFFGEHLAAAHPDRTLCLAESEKSALVMACADRTDRHVYLATGGASALNPRPETLADPYSRFAAIRDRDVILYPDADMVPAWSHAADALTSWCRTIRLHDVTGPPCSLTGSRDIADYILSRHPPPPACRPAGLKNYCSSTNMAGWPPMPRIQYFTAYRLSSSFRILLYVPMSRMCSVRKLLVTLRWKQQ